VPLLCPPKPRVPLPAARCCLPQRDVKHHVRGRYSSFIAHTDSCARPNPPPTTSVLLSPSGPCRLSPVPAGRSPFPTLSPQSLYKCLDPYPVVFFQCVYSFLPGRHRPHVTWETFGTPDNPCNATSTESRITGLQSFAYVQAPILVRPPDCTYRCGSQMENLAAPRNLPMSFKHLGRCPLKISTDSIDNACYRKTSKKRFLITSPHLTPNWSLQIKKLYRHHAGQLSICG
jgi:hypothetical protein